VVIGEDAGVSPALFLRVTWWWIACAGGGLASAAGVAATGRPVGEGDGNVDGIGEAGLRSPGRSGSGRCLVLRDQIGPHAASVFDVVPFSFAQARTARSVHRAGPQPAAGAVARPARRPAGLPGVFDVLPQRSAQI
jgi:hypothetical protein